MKKLFNLILVTIVVISITSCEDDDWSNLQAHNSNQNNNNPIETKTIQTISNDRNAWYFGNIGQYGSARTHNNNDFTNWDLSIDCATGSLNETTRGDINHWTGTTSELGYGNGYIQLDTKVTNDMNEWTYEYYNDYMWLNNYPNHEKLIFNIKTETHNDYNSLVVYNDKDERLFNITTKSHNVFTFWTFSDFPSLDSGESVGLITSYIIPVIIAANAHSDVK